MQKDLQQQAIVKTTELGREVRRQLRGPYGEEYENFDERETRFTRVGLLARERKFDELKDIKKSQQCCAICVEDFTVNDLVRETQCHHVFHSNCLMLWAKSKLWANLRRIGVPSCPNCNASLLEQQKISKMAPIAVYLPALESGTEEQSAISGVLPAPNNNGIDASNSMQPINNIDIGASDRERQGLQSSELLD